MKSKILFTQEEGYVIATDVITGVTSQGRTEEEARKNLEEALELYYEEDDEKLSQRLLNKYQMIGNIKELREKLWSIQDLYEGFVGEIMRYATTSFTRKEKVMNYLENNPQATSSQVVEFVMRQPDFHDAARQTELEHMLFEIEDAYEGFIIAVLNYVSRKVGRVQVVMDFMKKNPDALASDILEFISNQDDFFEDAAVDYEIFFAEFKEECLQYPPDLNKIKEMLKRAGDINTFPSDEAHNFLSDIIHWSVDTNPCNTCKIVDYGNMNDNEIDELCEKHEKECNEKQQELMNTRDGRYVPDIVELILKNGFKTDDKEGLIAKNCWIEIVHSTFDKYMLDIAKVLLKYKVEVPKVVLGDILFVEYLEEHEGTARIVFDDAEQADALSQIIELIRSADSKN